MRQLVVILCSVLLTGSAPAEDWQRKAVEMHPQLGVAGSAFNKQFWALYQDRQKTNPDFLKNPQWPVLLAQECAAQQPAPAIRRIVPVMPPLTPPTLNPQGPPMLTSTTAAPAKAKPVELTSGKKLYNAKCGRCHDAPPASVAEGAWTSMLDKWRGRAQLTEDEYAQLIKYGKLVREARQPKGSRQ